MDSSDGLWMVFHGDISKDFFGRKREILIELNEFICEERGGAMGRQGNSLSYLSPEGIRHWRKMGDIERNAAKFIRKLLGNCYTLVFVGRSNSMKTKNL